MMHQLNILTYLESKRIWEYSYLDRHAALQYAYKKEFEMINESVLTASEFGLITMSDKTNALWELNPRARRYRMHKNLEIFKHYGVSLPDMLKMPRHEVDMLLEEQQHDIVMAQRKSAELEREAKRVQQENDRKAHETGRWPGSAT